MNKHRLIQVLFLVSIAIVSGLYLRQAVTSNPKGELVPTDLQTISYQTTDKVTIVADYYPGRGDALGLSPVVVLIHMLGRDRTSWGDFPVKLQEQGFAVVALDLRGHGRSTKQGDRTISYQDFTDADWGKIDYDLHATMDYLPKLKVKLDHIYVVGASIGANEGLIISTEAPVRAVVLLSAGEDYRGIKTYPAAKEYQGRKALIVSSSEDTQSYAPSQEITSLIGSSATFVGLTGAGHGSAMLQSSPELVSRIISFLESN